MGAEHGQPGLSRLLLRLLCLLRTICSGHIPSNESPAVAASTEVRVGRGWAEGWRLAVPSPARPCKPPLPATK